MKARFIAVMLLVAALFFGVFSLHAQAPMKMKVGVSPVISSSGFYLADLRGYFKEQGLDVELIPFGKSGPEILPLVAGGKLTVGGGSLNPGIYNAIAQGVQVKIVADKAKIDPQDSHDALLVRSDHIASGRYKTGADLKGMTIATPSPGLTNILMIALERYLAKFNLTLRDVNLVTVPFPEQVAALTGKKIDAACAIEPFVAKAVMDGVAKRVAGFEESIPGYQVAVVFYGEDFIKNHPEEAKKFMVAYIKGLRDYINAFRHGVDYENVVNDLVKVLKVKDKALYKKMRVTGFDPNGFVDRASIADAQDWFYAKRLIKKKVAIDNVIDNSFCRHAVSVLGEYQAPQP